MHIQAANLDKPIFFQINGRRQHEDTQYEIDGTAGVIGSGDDSTQRLGRGVAAQKQQNNGLAQNLEQLTEQLREDIAHFRV